MSDEEMGTGPQLALGHARPATIDTHGITLDTVLTNGSTLLKVLEHARRELHDARTADRFKGVGAKERARRVDVAVGRLQAYVNVCILLGLNPEEPE